MKINPDEWTEAVAAHVTIALINESKSNSQAVMAMLSFCLAIIDDGCDLHKFQPIIDAHARWCKEQEIGLN